MMSLRISHLGIWGFGGLGIQWFQGERSNVKVYNVGEPIPIRLFEVALSGSVSRFVRDGF